MDVAPITDTERFFARVERRSPAQCWWWTGSIVVSTNYPQMKRSDGAVAGIARFAWEVAYLRGPIPAGFVITRREHDWDDCEAGKNCVHRLCMNPDHMRLELKSTGDAERMRERNEPRTVCRKGHPLTDGNVVWVSRAQNKRMCRICFNRIQRRYRRNHL